jgi:hypothetical protein
MAATNPKVMAMIERELAKDPSISNEALLEKAKKIDASVGGLSARQFNARYPLQVKRRKDGPAAKKGGGKRKAAKAKGATKAKASSKGRKAGRAKAKPKAAAKSGGRGRKRAARKAATGAPRAASGGDREAVRKILLDYARKVSAANSMTDMVDLVMDVDRYVDRVMKAAS